MSICCPFLELVSRGITATAAAAYVGVPWATWQSWLKTNNATARERFDLANALIAGKGLSGRAPCMQYDASNHGPSLVDCIINISGFD